MVLPFLDKSNHRHGTYGARGWLCGCHRGKSNAESWSPAGYPDSRLWSGAQESAFWVPQPNRGIKKETVLNIYNSCGHRKREIQ